MDGDNVVPVFGNLADITAPTFTGVTIDKTMRDKAVAGVVTFKGNYDFRTFTAEDRSILLLGAENTLYWPQSGASIGACRAYFQLADGAEAREFKLNFGEETTGIISTTDFTDYTDKAGAWYTLDGRKLDKKPTTKGLYIYGGRKVVIP